MNKKISLPVIGFLCLLFLLATGVSGAEVPPADYVEPITGMEFMAIPAGSFTMGNNQDFHARPEHEVAIRAFLLGRFEVTFEQYAKFCGDTGRLIPANGGWGFENRPVINVSWQDATDFTKWLSEKTGKVFRLPNEAEWEYAARGGAATTYPWGDNIGSNQANCNGCSSQWDNRMTAPVGSFPANGYGLYDMLGNVYEWCLDYRHGNYIGAPVDGSAWLEADAEGFRINRGASWRQPVSEMVITRRCWDPEGRKLDELGFRVLLEK